MKACIKRYEPGSEYYFDEGCFINELSNSADDPEVSIARARVAPGQTTRWHRLHGVFERYLVLEGSGLAEVTDLEPVEVGPGDVVIIPPGAAQRITSTGERDLVFLAICSPPFTEQAYEEISPEI
jgi:mannose-6-phosphate isomerase-like protein (cupin superfamily)